MTLAFWALMATNLIWLVLLASGRLRWSHPDLKPKCPECVLGMPGPVRAEARRTLPMWEEPIPPLH